MLRERVSVRFQLLCAACIVGLLSPSGQTKPTMLPRKARVFSLHGAVVVAPRADREAAARLGFPVVSPDEVMDETGLRWKAAFRGRPLVLVGNVNTNRALLPLYVGSLSAADAFYPGGEGYVVRKLTLPQSVLVLAGSSERGVARAVAAYLADPEPCVQVKLGGEAAKTVSASIQSNVTLNAFLFLLRGERRFADAAAAQFRKEAGGPDDYFHVGHYHLEPEARGYRLLAAHGVLSPADLLAWDNAWLRKLIAEQNEYWRARSGTRIGSRHQTMGTSAFHFVVRMLLADGSPNPEARALLQRWDRECRAYFNNALATFHDDIEGIPSYHSVQPMVHWALEQGRADYLNKQLPRALARALAVTDSLGAYAGTGTYEEARPGTVKSGIMLGYPLAVYVYWTHDPQWNWLLRHFVRGIGTWGLYYVWKTHGFATNLAEEQEPHSKLGLQIAPLGSYRRRRLKESNAHRTLFEKLSWRSGWDRSAAYLVLQGWQGAAADNQPPRDANALLRYTNRGHVWLFSNCRKAGKFYRNAVFVSRGVNDRPQPPEVELLSRRDRAGVIMTATRLRNDNGADWTRYVWWVRGRYVVVADQVAFTQPGQYTVLCSWRSAQPARLTGNVWESRAGGSVFRLVNLTAAASLRAETGPVDGAALPWFLREQKTITAKPGDRTWFWNVFAVDEPLAAARRQDGVVLRNVGGAVVRDGVMDWQPWSGSWRNLAFLGLETTPTPTDNKRQTGETGSSFTLARQQVTGLTVSAEPPPVQGDLTNLTDSLASPYAGATWPKGTSPTLIIRLPQPEQIWSVELGLPLLARRNTLPDHLPAPFEADVNGRRVRFVCELDVQPLHKGTVYPFARFAARDLRLYTDQLRLTIPLTHVRRVWVRRRAVAPLNVLAVQRCDVDADGQQETVVATDQREVGLVGTDGRIRWRHRFRSPITAVHADREVLVTTREADLTCLDGRGRVQWQTSFLTVPDLGGDCPTGYSIARWGDALVVGNYARATFLGGRGQVESTTFAYGAFETGWLPAVGDLTGDGVADGLLFNVWATLSIIDGKTQKTVGYVPCPRGALKLLCALDKPTAADPRVLVVTEDGAALLNPRTHGIRWRHDLAPVAAAVRFAGGTAVAKQEGFLLFIQDDGVVTRIRSVDDAPVAMAAVSDRLFLSTHSAVDVFNPQLQRIERMQPPCAALCAANGNVVGVTRWGRIVRLSARVSK